MTKLTAGTKKHEKTVKISHNYLELFKIEQNFQPKIVKKKKPRP